MKPTKNEIKKALYRQKPIAKILHKTEPSYFYLARIESLDWNQLFIVNVKEIGENVFEEEVPAQLLIRWMWYDNKIG